MKLKNKISGEIKEFALFDGNELQGGVTLEILTKEWEDYEELKEYWYIDWNGEVCRSDIHDERTEQMKLIGNYFETKEEAEKAVEKLKAWKRLKDDGFTIRGYEDTDRGMMGDLTIYTSIPECNLDDRGQDLGLLFCPEENS